MQRIFRPLLGFGLWGWLLLPIAAALAFCFLGGYDLRTAIMRWWYDRFGWDSMLRLISPGLRAYWWSLAGVVVGPVTLMPVLLAMYLSPRRWAWWAWLLVVVWLLVNPALWWATCQYLPRNIAGHLGWSRRGSPEILPVTLAQLAIFAAFAWRLAGRRSALILLGAGTIAGAIAWSADWWENTGHRPGLPFSAYVTLGILWHATVFIVLVSSATWTRRRAAAETWLCESCGYDLRGLSTSATNCPECGREQAVLDPVAAAPTTLRRRR